MDLHGRRAPPPSGQQQRVRVVVVIHDGLSLGTPLHLEETAGDGEWRRTEGDKVGYVGFNKITAGAIEIITIYIDA